MSEYGKSFIAKEAIEFLDSLGPRAEVLSPRKEEVDYDKLAVENLDQLIGALGGLTDNKDKITQVLDKILGAGVQSPEDKDVVEENTDKVPDDESGEA